MPRAGFESLVEVFAENWDLYDEIGAGFCLYLDGDEKVSIWGGLADPSAGRPWQEDTMAVTFSATKGVTAICIHQLAEQNRIDLDAPGRPVLARVWRRRKGQHLDPLGPEPSGRPLFDRGAPDARGSARRSARRGRAGAAGARVGAGLRPSVPPAQLRVHPRRAGAPRHRKDAGRAYVREDIGAPIDADVWIGLPADQEHRVARLFPGYGRAAARYRQRDGGDG